MTTTMNAADALDAAEYIRERRQGLASDGAAEEWPELQHFISIADQLAAHVIAESEKAGMARKRPAEPPHADLTAEGLAIVGQLTDMERKLGDIRRQLSKWLDNLADADKALASLDALKAYLK